MKNVIKILVLTILVVSCEIKDIDFEGMESYKLEKFENNEATLLLKMKINNENWFKLKLKPSELKVTAGGKDLGTLVLDKKVKIKGKTSQSYDAKLRFKLADGALFLLPTLMMKDEVVLTFEGKVKGGVFIFSKKIDIKETKTVQTKDLKINPFQ